MPHGGRITIETANKWLDDRGARERQFPPGQYISVCVTDTGTGMTPDVVAQAFDPFFTTKPIGQGTGLGLSMTRGFVRQSGGQVRIYSEVEKGTTVCLYLPRHAGSANDADVPEADRVSDPLHGETVLIIDDEPAVRMLMVEVLEEAGYRAIEANDGPAGLKVLQLKTRVGLLVSDVHGAQNGRKDGAAGWRRMIVRRAVQAGIITSIGCHTFRASGITVYLLNGGLLEYAQQMAGHESARTTKLYDRRNDQMTLDQMERIML
jgi:hypothetical protein